MRRSDGFLLIGLDVLLNLLVLFLLAFFAMVFDSRRGLGDLSFSAVEFAHTEARPRAAVSRAGRFVAVVVDETQIAIYSFTTGVTRKLGVFRSFEEFKESFQVVEGELYVLYERSRSSFIEDLIRFLHVRVDRMGVVLVDE